MVKPVCIVSIILNVLCILLLVCALSAQRSFIAYPAMDTEEQRYTTAACLVSVPEGAPVVFSPVEFTLRSGETAALQFSALREGRQLTISIDPLYDRAVVSVEQSAYGLLITAHTPGGAVLQTLTSSGIRDIAVVTVTE